MPHKHKPNSKHSKKKREWLEKYKILRGSFVDSFLIFDRESHELIATKNSLILEKGEVIKGPKFYSPILREKDSFEVLLNIEGPKKKFSKTRIRFNK